MRRQLKILFVFVDGVGIGPDDSAVNPLCNVRFPALRTLLNGKFQAPEKKFQGLEAFFQPLDAELGVKGLPQSATGQTTLYTGVNAAREMGRHIEGFPPPCLKELVRRENIFSRLRNLGKRCAFANAYWLDDVAELPARRHSVTTVMTLAALVRVRGKDKLLNNEAVWHDLTRKHLHLRGYQGPSIPPEKAADHLQDIAEQNDFTLFEYFLTDHVGHRCDMQHAFETLENLERFLPRAAHFADRPNHLFILTSDHGNIEDLSSFTHTANLVPFLALGEGANEYFQEVKSLTDVAPAILNLYGS